VADEKGPAVQILNHDAVEANLPQSAGLPVVIEGRNGQVSQPAAGRVTEVGVADSRTSFGRTVR
jgi:hypothetical protein